jgi:lysophospholipase L1-like esterase
MSRASRARRIVSAAVYGGGSIGALGVAAYGLIYGESKLARRRIRPSEVPPPHADGLWHGAGPMKLQEPLRLAMLGDSSAAGLGVHIDAETPGALLAVGLSGCLHRPVELINAAIVGAKSADLTAQVDKVLPTQPAIAVIMIGANDVTHRIKPATSVRYLATEVARLRATGCQVVVGTCPDLGTIKPIAQPLRSIARHLSRNLAAAQTIAVVESGGRTVSLGDILGPQFAVRRDMFSEDQFHPSAAGYAAAAEVLLPSLVAALGVRTDTEPASKFTHQRARPVAAAAARAAARPGSEVAPAEVAGESRGKHGRWAQLLRRQTAS